MNLKNATMYDFKTESLQVIYALNVTSKTLRAWNNIRMTLGALSLMPVKYDIRAEEIWLSLVPMRKLRG